MNEPKKRDDVIETRLNQLINKKIGILKDSRGRWTQNEASIDTLLFIITTVYSACFVVACCSNQNGVDAIVI